MNDVMLAHVELSGKTVTDRVRGGVYEALFLELSFRSLLFALFFYEYLLRVCAAMMAW